MIPADGERNALRGYIRQYEFSGILIHKGIVDGNLKRIGLAHRNAGKFDDLVLEYANKVIGHQVKTTRTPNTFSVKTLLVGSEGWLKLLIEAMTKFQSFAEGKDIELVYCTQDIPMSNDNICSEAAQRVSSAALIRAHNAYRDIWDKKKWYASHYKEFIEELKTKSDLDEDQFFELWRCLRFELLPAKLDAFHQTARRSASDFVTKIAEKIPNLIVKYDEQYIWTKQEFIAAVGLVDPLKTKREHQFPIPRYLRINDIAETELSQKTAAIKQGYLSLLGSPGSGKSTTLQSSVFSFKNLVVISYLAFSPNEGLGLGRAEAFDFLHDILVTFNRQHQFKNMEVATELSELRMQLESRLEEAAKLYTEKNIKTLIMVDGLDHIPREENPQHSLLSVLPLPAAIPVGVVFLLGSQKLELGSNFPRSIADQAEKLERCVNIPPLSRVAIFDLGEEAGISKTDDLETLWQISKGHPLSAQYVITALTNPDPTFDKEDWLRSLEERGEDIDEFHERAWREMDQNEAAKKALSYLSLVEGSIHPTTIDRLAGSAATDALYKFTRHLISESADGSWQVFHNSFRLFIAGKTLARFGKLDSHLKTTRYTELADVVSTLNVPDPQSWMELRYRARAEDYESVLQLATIEYFREQFLTGRSKHLTLEDIKFAYTACSLLDDKQKLFELIVAHHESTVRTSEIDGDNLISAYIAVGNIDRAIAVLKDGTGYQSTDATYDVIDELLYVGRYDDAKQLFDEAEPLHFLRGVQDSFATTDERELEQWAKYAIHFHSPDKICTFINNIDLTERDSRRIHHQIGYEKQLKQKIKLTAAENYFFQHETESRTKVGKLFQISKLNQKYLLAWSIQQNFEGGKYSLISMDIKRFAQLVDGFDNSWKFEIARIAVKCKYNEQARQIAKSLTISKLNEIGFEERRKGLFGHLREIYIAAALAERLNLPNFQFDASTKPFNQNLQLQFSKLGKYYGKSITSKTKEAGGFLNLAIQIIKTLSLASNDPDDFQFTDSVEFVLPRVIELFFNEAVHINNEIALNLLSQIHELAEKHPQSRLSRVNSQRKLAMLQFSIDHDSETAKSTMSLGGLDKIYDTPQQFVEAMAEEVKILVKLRYPDEAMRITNGILSKLLGISLPPKKDGQYALWRELTQKANTVDPKRADMRTQYLCRFLLAIARAEGRGMARRIVPDILVEAIKASPPMGLLAMRSFNNDGLFDWPTLIGAVSLGIAKHNEKYFGVTLQLITHLAIPFGATNAKIKLNEILSTYQNGNITRAINSLGRSIAVDGTLSSKNQFRSDLIVFLKEHCLDVPEILNEITPQTIDDRDGGCFSDVTNLTEVETAHKKQLEQENFPSTYHLTKALKKVAGTSNVNDLTRFCRKTEFKDDTRILLIAAEQELKRGSQTVVESIKYDINQITQERSGWSHWNGSHKLHLYQLLKELLPADEDTAFTVFTNDLAQDQEDIRGVYPNLVDIFEVFGDNFEWAQAWEAMRRHLDAFRELQYPSTKLEEVEEADIIDVIVAILFEAITLSAQSLVNQSMTAIRAISLENLGPQVILRLLKKLATYGDERTPQIVRIAWENRALEKIADWSKTQLNDWHSSPDIAVVTYAEALALYYQRRISRTHLDLPAFYSLQLPDNPEANNFDPPSGQTSYSSGLLSDDAYTWTWSLRIVAKQIARKSGFSINQIRQRAAFFMRSFGGLDSFGPAANDRQKKLFEKYELRTMYHLLMPYAAFRAARYVAAELFHSGYIDHDCVAMVLQESAIAAPSLLLPLAEPIPRQLSKPNIPRYMAAKEQSEWLSFADWQPIWPTLDGQVIIGGCQQFQHSSDRETTAEQSLFFRYSFENSYNNFESALQEVPFSLPVGSDTIPLYEEFSMCAISFLAHDTTGLVPDYFLALCPRIAYNLGLVYNPNNLGSYIDRATKKIVAGTLYWRENGIKQHTSFGNLYSRGNYVWMEPAYFEKLTHLTDLTHPQVYGWRSKREQANPEKDLEASSRRIFD